MEVFIDDIQDIYNATHILEKICSCTIKQVEVITAGIYDNIDSEITRN